MDKNKNIKIFKVDCFEKPEYSLVIDTANQRKRVIKRIENIIRSSKEYRDYIQYLKEYVDMTKCAFFNNVSNKDSSKIKIEIHHEPFTLFDIVSAVVDKWIDEAAPLNELYIADEVMLLHYQNKVGLIPLSKTVHTMYHKANNFVIPLNWVFGNYKSFVEEYDKYIDYEKLQKKIELTRSINKDSFNIFNKQFEYIEVDGVSLPKKIENEKVG